MAKYLDKWKTDFPASVGNVTRPTDGIDDTLDFNSDGFSQRISSDPVHYKLENDMASQLFSNDARLKEAIDANKAAGDDTLANHNKSAQSHANGIAGNAASATKLKTARRINVIGDCLTGKAASFDGSDNADIEVALTTALKALGGLSPSVDKLPYFTGANAASLASLSEFMRGVLGKATAAEVRTAIGAINEPGVGVIAGDVSNANAWWVKLSGAVPLIIQGGFSSSGTFTYPISISRFLTGGVTSRMTSRNYDSDWGDIIRTPTSSYFRFRKNGYSDGSYCWLIGL
mgnify:CR=1 FL=1